MAGEMLPLALLLTMLVCIVLGMGLPTSAAYIVASTIAVPVLSGLGIEPLSAHFFVFYFAILAGITPPVAITSFIAAGIARAPSGLTSMIALRIALPGFIVPFLFVSNVGLLMSENSTWIMSLVAFATSLLGVFALTVAFEGYYVEKLNILQRLLYAATASLFLLVDWTSDVAALLAFLTLAAYSWLRVRRTAQATMPVNETR